MSELSKLLNQYGLTTASMAGYAGATMPNAVAPITRGTDETDANWNTRLAAYNNSQAQYNNDLANYYTNGAADKASYDAYAQEYKNRIQNTPQYTGAQYQTSPQASQTTGATTGTANAVPATVEEMYSKYLNRPGDQSGVDYWKNAFGSQISPQEQAAFLSAATPEMNKAGLNTYGQQIANATGNYWTDKLKSPTYSAAATGTTGSTSVPTTAPLTVEELYTRYLGRPGDQAGIDYWKNAFGPEISPQEQQDFINSANKEVLSRTSGNTAQGTPANTFNNDTTGYSRGGGVRPLAHKYDVGGRITKSLGDVTGQPVDDPSMLVTGKPEGIVMPPPEQTPVQNSSAQSNSTAAAMARYRASNKDYMDMLSKTFSSPEQKRAGEAEGYYRLAAALGAPTRTGNFGEALARGAGELAETEKAKQESALNQAKMRLTAQKYNADVAKEDVYAAMMGDKMAQARLDKQVELAYKTKQDSFKNDIEQQRVANETRKASAYEKSMESYLKQFGKPPAGQRWSADGTTLEDIPGGPTAKAAEVKKLSQKQISDGVEEMKAAYAKLLELGAIKTNMNDNVLQDAIAGMSSSPAGQALAQKLGTDAQRYRDFIVMKKNMLIGPFMKASGETSQMLRTNMEQTNAKSAMGDPSYPFEANMDILNSFERTFGEGRTKDAKTAPVKENTATAPIKQTPLQVALEKYKNPVK